MQWFPAIKGARAAQGEEAIKAALAQVSEGLAYLEEAFVKGSQGKDFFGGDRIGYLDIAFGCFLAWLRVTEKMNNVTLLDEINMPNLFRWAEKFCADSSVKDVMPHTDKLFEFAKFLAKLGAPKK